MTESTPRTGTAQAADPPVPPGVDPTTPSPARLYDYYLGGTQNFQADRDAAERIRAVMPALSDAAWANRSFHQRSARWLARRGITQFIDIGSGLPTAGNTHELVQQVNPGARVVYADIDPMVAPHAASLLGEDGGTAVITADLRDPDAVLSHPDLRALIDFTEPAGLLMTAVLHFVAPEDNPHGLVRRYLNALAPGSYLALSHATADQIPPRAVRAGTSEYTRASGSIFPRPRSQVERFFEGLELVPPYQGGGPAVCYVGEWGAEDPQLADSDGSRVLYCGVARLP